MPFMKTLRRSFSPAASPGSAPTTSTGIPSGPKSSAKRSAPSPEASARRAEARLGHDADQRDVGELHGQRVGELPLQLRRRGVQVGVERVPASEPATSRAASSATDAALTLSTTSAPRTASRALAAFAIPSGRRAGSQPRTTQPAADEIGGDPAARLAEAEDGDLHHPSTISRSPFRS